MVATLKCDTIKEVNSSVDNLALDSSGNVTVGNNLTVTGTTTQTGNVSFTGSAAVGGNVTVGGATFSPSTPASGSVAITGTLAMGSSFLRNRIINGDFSIAQRATTYALTSSVAYGSVDRWAFFQSGTANGVANQISSGLTGFQYALKLGRNNGATQTGVIGALQAIETVNSIVFAGQSVTLSFYAKAGANFSASSSNISVQVYSGTGTDQSASTWVNSGWTGGAYPVSTTQAITSSWVKYTFTGTVSSSATQLGVQFQYTPTGTAGADDNLYITGVQLEVGSVATPFERRQYGQELALCQRYFCKLSPTLAFSYTSTTATFNFTFPVFMRANPTASYKSGTAELDPISGSNVTPSSVSIFYSVRDTQSALGTSSNYSGLTTPKIYWVVANAILSYFDAEL